MSEDILEPLKQYNGSLKNEIRKNATEYFDELIKKADINVDENQKTILEYNRKNVEISETKSSNSKWKVIRGLCIIGLVLGLICSAWSIASLCSVFKKALEIYIYIIVLILGALMFVGMIVLLVKKVNKIINDKNSFLKKLQEEASNLMSLALSQVENINSYYDFDMPADVIHKTTPLIKLDKFFDVKKYYYLQKEYGFHDVNDKCISIFHIQSGSIVGNQFIWFRELEQSVGSQRYFGELSINWQEWVEHSDGSSELVTKSQTLEAFVDKPIPLYDFTTSLVYCNGAAPDLSFSRSPSNASNMSDKQIDKMVKKGEKYLAKKTKKTMGTDNQFTEMGNSEFDVLFGAIDRDNETQFRLLFTPLAQKNELSLIKSKDSFGDDFYFSKVEQVNYITSSHSQNQDIYCDPLKYKSYDILKSKELFIDYTCDFFKALFFDLAPLLSIPLYQQNKPKEYVYSDEYKTNFTSYEEESIINSFNQSVFEHKDAKTTSILKSRFIKKTGNSDRIVVQAYAYTTEERIDYVSVKGGDDYYHDVPVPWLEYIQVEQDTHVLIKQFLKGRREYLKLFENEDFQNIINEYVYDDCILYQRGIIAMILKKEFDEAKEKEFDSLLER